jgi:hypothetical protein
MWRDTRSMSQGQRDQHVEIIAIVIAKDSSRGLWNHTQVSIDTLLLLLFIVYDLLLPVVVIKMVSMPSSFSSVGGRV